MLSRAALCSSVLFCAVLLLSACLEKPPADGTILCDPDEPTDCPLDFVCKPHVCPDDYRCYARVPVDRDYDDGENDHLSFGVRLSAVPVTIVDN